MNASAPSTPIRRLEQLSLGAAREIQRVGQADIFLYVARREYLTALRQICAGLESARVALAQAPAPRRQDVLRPPDCSGATLETKMLPARLL
jgi:hypothetical protein